MVVAQIVSVRVRVNADFPSQPFHILHSPSTSILTRSLSSVKLFHIFFETATASISRFIKTRLPLLQSPGLQQSSETWETYG
jgi:hypothetical protein